MYPIAWNVARVFGKNPRQALAFAILLPHAVACWTSSSPAPAPLHNEARPAPPAPARPRVHALRFGPVLNGELVIGSEIPHRPGSAFGWQVDLGCSDGERVDYDEQLRLPEPGDWGVDPEVTISHGGRVATVRSQLACTDGRLTKVWTLADDDPAGTWTIKVTVKGYATETFRLTFVP